VGRPVLPGLSSRAKKAPATGRGSAFWGAKIRTIIEKRKSKDKIIANNQLNHSNTLNFVSLLRFKVLIAKGR